MLFYKQKLFQIVYSEPFVVVGSHVAGRFVYFWASIDNLKTWNKKVGLTSRQGRFVQRVFCDLNVQMNQLLQGSLNKPKLFLLKESSEMLLWTLVENKFTLKIGPPQLDHWYNSEKYYL